MWFQRRFHVKYDFRFLWFLMLGKNDTNIINSLVKKVLMAEWTKSITLEAWTVVRYLVKLNSHWTRHDASRHDAALIRSASLDALRTHRVFWAMRQDASKLKKSIFDATRRIRTIKKVGKQDSKIHETFSINTKKLSMLWELKSYSKSNSLHSFYLISVC